MPSIDEVQRSPILISRIKLSGLLSFGPKGIDLPLTGLNVFIGPNGSGKSNFIEAIALLRAAPSSLSAPVKEMGGVREWLWKGKGAKKEAVIDVVVTNTGELQSLRHVLHIQEHGSRFEVTDERVENECADPGKAEPYYYYRFRGGNPVLRDFQEQERKIGRDQLLPEESILSQFKDAERYPALSRLQHGYGNIRLFRNWTFGPGATLRREQSTHGRSDFLEDGGENLTLVLSKIWNKDKNDLIRSLKELYEGIEELGFMIDGGTVHMFVKESGGRQIPATRLSDGTLRYLCLLAILLHPDPPPLIVIEEPELGLHPDIIGHLAELLRGAALRTQVIVTTHSRVLVDALGEVPEAIVVCGKRDGESMFERLDGVKLKEWLERYSLGELWSIGELGGNRW